MASSPGAPAALSPRAQKLKDELLGEFSLTVDDVAGILEVDRSTVYRYIQEGALAGLKIGREYRLSEGDVKGFLQALVARERQRVDALRLKALSEPPETERRHVAAGRNMGQYSQRSAETIQRAQRDATQRGQQLVLPGHLLLALLSGGGIAQKALEGVGVDMAALGRTVADHLPAAAAAHPGDTAGEMGFAPAAAAVVMEHAHRVREEFGHHYVGTEHLLLALYAEPECAKLLEDAGAPRDAVKAEVTRVMGAPPTR